MGILEQIQQDINYINDNIRRATIDSMITQNGLQVEGIDKIRALKEYESILSAELTRLKVIIASGYIPSSYTSSVNKLTYYPSVYERLTKKQLPTDSHSVFVEKHSRKRDHLRHSEFTLHNKKDGTSVLKFTVEHTFWRAYPSGGAGKVKRGYSLSGTEYALKIFKKNIFGTNTIQEARIAMRSAFCSKLLGRTGFSFRRNDKQYLLTEWLPGDSLDKIDRSQIMDMPVPVRINLAINLTKELLVLHHHDISHGDIKPKNVMFSDKTLHLIDFDGARFENEKLTSLNSNIICTLQFCDAQLNWDIHRKDPALYQRFNKKSDCYALGLTLAYLFPDITEPTCENKSSIIKGSNKLFEFDSIMLWCATKFKEHEPLGQLIFKLASESEKDRPTINEALNQLEKIQLTYIHSGNVITNELKPLDKVKPCISGEEAFNQIDAELGYDNSALQVINSSFLLPVLIGTTIGGVMVYLASVYLQDTRAARQNAGIALGGAALTSLSYLLSGRTTAEDDSVNHPANLPKS